MYWSLSRYAEKKKQRTTIGVNAWEHIGQAGIVTVFKEAGDRVFTSALHI